MNKSGVKYTIEIDEFSKTATVTRDRFGTGIIGPTIHRKVWDLSFANMSVVVDAVEVPGPHDAQLARPVERIPTGKITFTLDGNVRDWGKPATKWGEAETPNNIRESSGLSPLPEGYIKTTPDEDIPEEKRGEFGSVRFPGEDWKPVNSVKLTNFKVV